MKLSSTESHWWWIKVGWGNGLWVTGIKPSIEPMLSHILSPLCVTGPQWDNEIRNLNFPIYEIMQFIVGVIDVILMLSLCTSLDVNRGRILMYMYVSCIRSILQNRNKFALLYRYFSHVRYWRNGKYIYKSLVFSSLWWRYLDTNEVFKMWQKYSVFSSWQKSFSLQHKIDSNMKCASFMFR